MALSSPDPALGDDVLQLRPWSLDDIECVSEASADPSIPPTTTVPSSWSSEAARHRGFARRAARLASDWAIGPGGFARIEAWVEPTNQPSQSVLSAAGFELEGRLRSFLTISDSRSDALVYSRVSDPGDAPILRVRPDAL